MFLFEYLQLVHQMRELRRLNLGEFQFPLRQLSQNLFRNRGRDARRAAVHELDDLWHGGRLIKPLLQTKRNPIGRNPERAPPAGAEQNAPALFFQ